MIDIKIWKIIENEYWEYDIEDFSLNREDLSDEDNYISYSWSTREYFLEDEELKEILERADFIKISKVIDILRTKRLNIPTYHDKKNIWEWFMTYCKESLRLFWEDAYIEHYWIVNTKEYFYNW